MIFIRIKIRIGKNGPDPHFVFKIKLKSLIFILSSLLFMRVDFDFVVVFRRFWLIFCNTDPIRSGCETIPDNDI